MSAKQSNVHSKASIGNKIFRYSIQDGKKKVSQDMSEKQQQPGASLLQLPQTAEGRPSGATGAKRVQRNCETEASARKNRSSGYCFVFYRVIKSFILESSKPLTDISLVLPWFPEVNRWQV